MLTMTLTEFNQNPSRATRLAEHGEVGILRRSTPNWRRDAPWTDRVSARPSPDAAAIRRG